MLLRRVGDAGTRPVSLDQGKAYLRVTNSAEDTLIAALIAAACDLVGEMSGRVLASETWAWSQPSFSGTETLPKSPVLALTSVAYVNSAGAAITATLGNFVLYLNDDLAQISPINGADWPDGDTSRPDGVTVTFTAGYTALPDSLRMAVLLLLGHYYTNREAVGAGMEELPLSIHHLTSAYRIGWAAA